MRATKPFLGTMYDSARGGKPYPTIPPQSLRNLHNRLVLSRLSSLRAASFEGASLPLLLDVRSTDECYGDFLPSLRGFRLGSVLLQLWIPA